MALSKMEYWKGLISEWKSSGETREIFCKRKGVTVATFSYWRTKLRKLDSENGNTNPLVRFSIPNLGKPDKIILEWPQGIRLQFPQDIRPAHLSNILRSIKESFE